MLTRKPLRKRRSKVRPGRLKGADMEALRRECFERDGYRCQAIRIERMGWFEIRWNQHIPIFGPRVCLAPVTWEGGHLAHRRNKRMHGDSLNQVQVECPRCHGEYHQYGPSRIKPCPPKPGREIGEAG